MSIKKEQISSWNHTSGHTSLLKREISTSIILRFPGNPGNQHLHYPAVPGKSRKLSLLPNLYLRSIVLPWNVVRAWFTDKFQWLRRRPGIFPEIKVFQVPRLNTDWYTYMQNDLHHGFSESPAPTDNTILWTAQSIGDYHEFTSLVIVDGIVYYPSRCGTDSLYALDAATGELIWKYRVWHHG